MEIQMIPKEEKPKEQSKNKEAWEMTFEEYVKNLVNESKKYSEVDYITYLSEIEKSNFERFEQNAQWQLDAFILEENKKKINIDVVNSLDLLIENPKNFKTFNRKPKVTIYGIITKQNKEITGFLPQLYVIWLKKIIKAISEDKPVPEEVLSEYPELKPQPEEKKQEKEIDEIEMVFGKGAKANDVLYGSKVPKSNESSPSMTVFEQDSDYLKILKQRNNVAYTLLKSAKERGVLGTSWSISQEIAYKALKSAEKDKDLTTEVARAVSEYIDKNESTEEKEPMKVQMIPKGTYKPKEKENIEPNKDEKRFIDDIQISILDKNPLNKTKRSALGEKYGITQQRKVKELTETAIVMLSREKTLDDELNPSQKYVELKEIYENQPTISEQDSTSKSAQQYSTPVPIAYAAGYFTMNPKIENAQVFEPSAGNGMLTVAYPPSQVIVNELDETRLESLEMQGYKKVMNINAAYPFKGMENKFDAVLTNPPFGSTIPVKVEGGFELSGLEHVMAYYALQTMKDDGRTAIIIGGHSRYDDQGRPTAGKERSFFYYLFTFYNVVDIINLDGSQLYRKQGTSFDIRLILINGRKKNPKLEIPKILSNAGSENTPFSKLVVINFERLWERIKFTKKLIDNENFKSETLLQSKMDANGEFGANVGNLDSRESKDSDTGRLGDVLERQQTDSFDSGSKKSKLLSGNDNGGDDTNDSDLYDDKRGDSQRYNQLGYDSTPNQLDGSKTSNTTRNQRFEPIDDKASDGDLLQFDIGTDIDDSKGELLSDKVALITDDFETPKPESKTDAGLVPYKPFSKAGGEDTLIPASMSTEAYKAIKKIENEVGDIDTFVAKRLNFTVNELRSVLFNYQIDAVAMAIYNMERGEGMIIGDQTGVGKGRTAAALIRYGRLQGKAPIFITQTVDLFSDLFRDLSGINTKFKPFIVNSNERIVDKEGDGSVLFRSMETTAQKKFFNSNPNVLEEGYDFIIATYSQFSNPKFPDKINFIIDQARGNFIILDESHNAGGEGTTSKVIRQAITASKGVTYLSATFAKRPDNMPVYSLKTVINEANMTMEQLIDAVKLGGVALQEIISSQLVEAGQMIRRERSFEGSVVNYITLGTQANKSDQENTKIIQRHIQAADKITAIMREIIDFQRNYVSDIVEQLDAKAAAEGEEIDTRKGTSAGGVDNTPYFSKIFNVVNQMLFSIKAGEIAELAINLSKEKKSVVIAFNSTMEAMLTALELEIGDVIENPDFAIVLQRGLDGVLKITKTDAQGIKTKEDIPVSMLSSQGQMMYKKIQQDIRKVATGISISPIDSIIDKLESAGLSVGEMTGRSKILKFNKNGSATLEPRRDKNKNETTRKFNAGELDVLLLNRSAATGISLHSSKTFKNQQKRAMIIAQPQLDINAEVQMRGRVHRVWQVVPPEYYYVSSAIPAEMRLMMMLKKKLKSLDANTTSNQKQSAKKVLDSEDFLNKYGDLIVLMYLIENPELNLGRLDDPLKVSGIDPSEPPVIENAAQKVTGRVAILSVAEQEKFYKDIIKEYNDYVDMLRQAGDYDLELESMPLEAKVLESRIAIKGNGGVSLFGADSILEKNEVNILRKPYTKKQLDTKIKEALEGKTAEKIQADTIEKHEVFIQDKIEKITQNAQNSIEKELQNAINKQTVKLGKALDKSEMYYITSEFERILEQTIEDKTSKFNEEQKYIKDLFRLLKVGKVVNVPLDLEGKTGGVKISKGVFIGFDIDYTSKNPFTRGRIKAKFAVMDSRKQINIPLSQTKSISGITARSFSIGDDEQRNTLENWDKLQSNKNREPRYIVTENILQAFAEFRGKFVDYTLQGGGNKKGIILPEEYEDRNIDANGREIPRVIKVPILKALPIIQGLSNGQTITTADGLVRFQRWSNGMTISVPQSKQKGGDYYLDSDLLALVKGGNFEKYANEMRAVIPSENVEYVVGILQQKFKQSIEISEAEAMQRIPEVLQVTKIEKPIIEITEPQVLEEEISIQEDEQDTDSYIKKIMIEDDLEQIKPSVEVVEEEIEPIANKPKVQEKERYDFKTIEEAKEYINAIRLDENIYYTQAATRLEVTTQISVKYGIKTTLGFLFQDLFFLDLEETPKITKSKKISNEWLINDLAENLLSRSIGIKQRAEMKEKVDTVFKNNDEEINKFKNISDINAKVGDVVSVYEKVDLETGELKQTPYKITKFEDGYVYGIPQDEIPDDLTPDEKEFYYDETEMGNVEDIKYKKISTPDQDQEPELETSTDAKDEIKEAIESLKTALKYVSGKEAKDEIKEAIDSLKTALKYL